MRLNLAAKELQKRLISANKQYYSTCVTTTALKGQNMYSLPSDFIQILRLDYITEGSGTTASHQKILPITPNQQDLLTDTQGPPQYYYFQGNNIILAPTPDATYTLDMLYSYFIADMVSGTDIPDAPQQFHEYIAVLATRDCLIKDARPLAPIETKLADFEKLLKEIAVQRNADAARMVVKTNFMDEY